MYFTGLIIGIATFLIIGLFHPLVIKGEYYFGVRIWWIFALMGIITIAASLMIENILWSTLLAVWGASSFWSIGELFEQRKRVERGWFPKRKKVSKGIVRGNFHGLALCRKIFLKRGVYIWPSKPVYIVKDKFLDVP